MHWLLRTDYRSFYFLNATQFLGALNDNVFKLLIVFLLINVEGEQYASSILAIAGAVFVIPFLFFSSAAGVLADRISKRNILVSMKISEVVLMSLSMIAIYLQSGPFCYSLLFLMAAQSTVFGPSKYGIIPELVNSKNVSKANGTINSFTYLAIIIGTFLASFISDITNKNFFLSSLACVFIALAGLLSCLGIVKTPPKGSKKRINPFFVYEIYQNLLISRKVPYLFPSILGSAYFLFLGGFTQLNIIPFAIQSLNLSEIEGGYLFLCTAIGIASGSLLAGKFCKEHPEPGLSCLAGLAVSILFFLLMLFSRFLVPVIIILILLGVAGGLFLVPFDSFIQIFSPDQKRGQIIAASNFLSFLGVLFASGFLYLISDVLFYTSASGFGWMALVTFLFTVFLTGRLSYLFFHFVSRKVLKIVYRIREDVAKPGDAPILILQSRKWKEAALLCIFYPQLHIITAGKKGKHFPWFHKLFQNISLFSYTQNETIPYQALFEEAKAFHKKNQPVLIFLRKKGSKNEWERVLQKFFKTGFDSINFVEFRKETLHKYWFPRKEIRTVFHEFIPEKNQ
jgi:acyl-[acyl-carrier-protein]-phospholipid O-acyltransferase / long-chain-fatty-acid--[acyl-carrier-protein] ligase